MWVYVKLLLCIDNNNVVDNLLLWRPEHSLWVLLIVFNKGDLALFLKFRGSVRARAMVMIVLLYWMMRSGPF